ncbi:MAG: ABC transporter ATP-binding protein [Thaumarchaeota archaeon]|nr:ABC transporter ATP-binding protein [Nitrososphaerota archaeon]
MADLNIQNLTKKYGQVVALNDVTLSIGSGEIVGLLGPNGAGKSTLLKIIVGILRPTSGSVVLDGIDVLKNPESAKRIIGYLPENAALYTGLTVTEFLQFVGKIRAVADSDLDSKISEALKAFDIEEKKNSLVGSLSKGTKQKVAIIASTLHEPRFLVLDEPLSGLDPKTQRFVNHWISSTAEKGVTVFLSTHNLDIAQDYASKIAIIDRGKIAAVGELNSLRKIANAKYDAKLDDVFLKLTSESS